MKPSERMRTMLEGDVGDGAWNMSEVDLDGVYRGACALEAALDDANVRAQDLTARCDRLRVERDAAAALARGLEDLAAEADRAFEEDAVACVRDHAEAIAVILLVYEMREHALRRRYLGECKCIEVQICGGPEDTHAECEERGARDQEAYEHGMADGIGCHQGDQRAMHRRAQAAESRATKLAREVATLRVRLQGAIAKIPPGDLWRMPDPVVEGAVCTGGGCAGNGPCCWVWDDPAIVAEANATIPPAALEATSGGARGLDAAEAREWCTGSGVGACSTCGEDLCVSGCDLEDLARRRVTERAEGDLPGAAEWEVDPTRHAMIEFTQQALHGECRAAIAERDARIVRMRSMIAPSTFTSATAYRVVLEILDGKEGA